MIPDPPPRRARSARWTSASFAALDFETTGLDLGNDVVVSFGVVPVDAGRVKVRDSIHQLVAPAVPPTPRSQTIHELRPQDLQHAPGIEEARDLLAAALAARFLLAWFADIEVHFLAAIFGGSLRRWRRRTIDVRNLAIACDGRPSSERRVPGYRLSATAASYGVPVANPHDALDDALVTAQLFLVLASKAPGGPDLSVRRLLRTAGA
ncbi:MAG TPA: 3'-5' exonuclease [Actinomycetota bacterium]|jgi:DNA polymerase-3 subunit epsilon|nr:3'-5' exonuclease [Actinomycetota bacterium]